MAWETGLCQEHRSWSFQPSGELQSPMPSKASCLMICGPVKIANDFSGHPTPHRQNPNTFIGNMILKTARGRRNSIASATRNLPFKSKRTDLLALWSWTCFLSSLGLNFLIYTMNIYLTQLRESEPMWKPTILSGGSWVYELSVSRKWRPGNIKCSALSHTAA